jgi:penicillin-binding protein 2
VFFYNVGMRMGIDRIAKYAKMLGLGSRTGIDLPSEEPGLVPSEEWVQRVFHHKWYPGSTISVAIGQGAVTVTPLQLAYMIGGVASGGVFKQPHLLKDAPHVGEVRVDLAEDTVEQVTQGMYGVVNEGGTGGAVKLQGIEFCGKSGSAQVMSNTERSRLGKSLSQNKDNAWFVGYAPRRNPEIVVSALVEGGEHGALASGPIVRDIVKAYYDKKNKKTPGQVTAGNQPQQIQKGEVKPVAEAPKVVLKPEETAEIVPTSEKKKVQPE